MAQEQIALRNLGGVPISTTVTTIQPGNTVFTGNPPNTTVNNQRPEGTPVLLPEFIINLGTSISWPFLKIVDILSEDTGKTKRDQMGCAFCKEKDEENTRLVKDMVAVNTDLQRKLADCERTRDHFKRRSEVLSKSLPDEFHKKTSGNTENPSHAFTNIKICKQYKDLKKKGDTILDKCYEGDDRQGIELLAGILKKCYQMCEDLARSQASKLLDPFEAFPDKTSKIIEDFEKDSLQLNSIEAESLAITIEDLYRVRYQLSQSQLAQDSLKKKALEFAFKDKSLTTLVTDGHEDGKSMLQEYVNLCIGCCWPMVIIYPKLKLRFCSAGEKFDKDHFTKMAMDDDIVQEGLPVGVIVQMVWPALELYDGNILERGEVIVTNKDGTG